MKKITKILLPAVALMAMGGQVVNPIANTLTEVHQNEVKKATVAAYPDPTASGAILTKVGTWTIEQADHYGELQYEGCNVYDSNGDNVYDTSGKVSSFYLGSYSGTASYVATKVVSSRFSSHSFANFGIECYQDISGYSVCPVSALDVDNRLISVGNNDQGHDEGQWSDYQCDLPSGKTAMFDVYAFTPASSLVDGQVKDLYYYVPNVPTLETILGGISAKDLFGAECTVSCSDTERNKYSQMIGVHAVQITATDTYGQTATATLNIHIIDNGKPVIALASGKNLSFVSGSSSLKAADLPSYFTITDVGTSYGGTIGTPSYTYDGASFADKTFGASDFGTHTVAVTVADSSGNSATANFSLSVTDGTAPVIARRDSSDVSTVIKIGVSRTFTLTKAEFLQIFKATDNIDGDLSANLDVEGDFIGNKVGNYSVKVVCSDKSGNKGSVTATVQVIADLPPVFILSDILVQATTAQPLTTADLSSVVTNGILSGKTVTACSVNAGTYIGNENVAGDYTITYDATVASGTKSVKRAVATNDVQGSFTLRVTKATDEEADTEKTHWYTPIAEFFQKLGNWFRGVFTKFKFDCFITNAGWDAKYPATEKGNGDSTSSPAVETSSTGEAVK